MVLILFRKPQSQEEQQGGQQQEQEREEDEVQVAVHVIEYAVHWADPDSSRAISLHLTSHPQDKQSILQQLATDICENEANADYSLLARGTRGTSSTSPYSSDEVSGNSLSRAVDPRRTADAPVLQVPILLKYLELFTPQLCIPILYAACMYRHQEEAGEDMGRESCPSSLKKQREEIDGNEEEAINDSSGHEDDFCRTPSSYNRCLMEHVCEAIEHFFHVNHFGSPVEAVTFVLKVIFSELSTKEPNSAAIKVLIERFPGALLYPSRTGIDIPANINSSFYIATHYYQNTPSSASSNNNTPLGTESGDELGIGMVGRQQEENELCEDDFKHTPLNLVCNHSQNPFFIVSLLQAGTPVNEDTEEYFCLLDSLITSHERNILPVSVIAETLIRRKDKVCSQVLRLLKEIKAVQTKRAAGRNDNQGEAMEKAINIGNLFGAAAFKGHTETLIALLEMNPGAIFQKNSENFYMPLQNTVLEFRYGDTEPDALHFLRQEEWGARVTFLLNEGLNFGIRSYQNSSLSPSSRSEMLYLLGGLFDVDTEHDGFLNEIIFLFGHSKAWDLLKSCLRQYLYQEAPILHAAIGKVHKDVLQGIIDNFEDSAFSRDHKGNLALHVGIKKRFKWTQGLSDIFHANPSAVKEVEVSTGLPLFAFAAVCQVDDKGQQREKTDMKTLFKLCMRGLAGP